MWLQDDQLETGLNAMDNATPANLKALKKKGESLLKKKATKLNIDTGVNEPDNRNITNQELLTRYLIDQLQINYFSI